MAHSGKAMTFATDLVPQEDNIYNLGNSSQRWKIYGDVQPYTSRIYPVLGTTGERSAWYKITFPYHNATTGSAAKWFMNSFDLHFGGGYSSNPSGVAHISFYWTRAANNGAWTLGQGATFVEGVLANKVVFYYRIAEPGILYVNNTANAYNGIWLDNLYVDDTSPSLDWSTTKIETTSAITANTDPALSAYTILSTTYLYNSGGTLKTDSNFEGKYIKGTWLYTSAATAKTSTTKLATIESDNFIYYITPANALKSAVGTTAIGGSTTPIYWDGSVFQAGTALSDGAYKSILNNTSKGALGWNSGGSTNADNLRLINVNTLAYWNGAYSGTSSNLSVLGTVTTGTWNASVIGAAYGGTGQNTLQKSANVLINALDTGSSDLTANDYVITQYVGGGTTTTSYHRRPASKVINATLVKAALETNATHGGAFLRKDGTWVVPPDTNKYHKTGSWSGLTYTATAVNNADELEFTIPNKIQTNWELNATSGNSPALLFTRDGTLTDWKVFVNSGKLSFQSATNGTTWTERAYFKDNSGDFVATSFTGNGSALTSLNASNISSGTLNLARLGNQNANVVLAGPSSGSAAAPTFRELVAADIPNLNWSKITSGKPTTLSGYGITDAKIASGTITLGSNTISPVTAINWDSTNKKLTRTINGTAADVVTAATLRTDLGLSNALHFIGITSTTLTDGSTTATLIAKSTNSLTKTTGFVDGDVVMDGDQLREYVWSGSAWRLLGITTSTAYTQPASTATNTWIAQVSQGTDGKITATTGSLNTSGTWSGTASKATTTANTTDSIYPVGVKSGATTTLLHDTSITMKGNAITAVTYNSTAASLTSETSTTANTAKYATLTLGNNANVSSTTAHSEGQIIIYSAATQAHTIKGTSTTTAYTHTLPNDTGLLVSLSSGTAKGSSTKPVYIPNTGIVTECSTYAGGTKVTFNGADKGASTASFYAPTSGGTAGNVLISAGTSAPAWYGGAAMTGTAAASWKTTFNGTTDATASNAAAVTIAGGLGIAKSIIVGEIATVADDILSPKFTLTVNGTDKAYLQYNATDDSIDFIFV